jgi:hypothetical protein
MLTVLTSVHLLHNRYLVICKQHMLWYVKRISMSERIAVQVHALGLEREAIVVDGGALDGTVRDAEGLALAVTENTFRALRFTHSWKEGFTPDGQPLLTRDNAEVSVGWGNKTTEALHPNSYLIDGVTFAGLPEVYAWKQQSGHKKDADDASLIRKRLYDRPLPLRMLERELAYVRECLPHALRHEPALAVAANGLYMVRTLFGDHHNSVNTYTGLGEPGDVPALNHDYWHSANGVERVARHIAKVNQGRLAVGRSVIFNKADTLASLVAYAYHDSDIDAGRQSKNPFGFNELISANIAARHLTVSGFTEHDMPEKSYVGIRATGFNEEHKTQDIDPDRGYLHIQKAIAGTDLGVLAESDFIIESLNLSIEDLCRIGAGFDRPLGRFAAGLRVRITTAAQGLDLIDSSPALLHQFGLHILRSSQFCKKHEHNDEWSLKNYALQQQNAQFSAMLGQNIIDGRLTATHAYALAREHVLDMRRMAA